MKRFTLAIVCFVLLLVLTTGVVWFFRHDEARHPSPPASDAQPVRPSRFVRVQEVPEASTDDSLLLQTTPAGPDSGVSHGKTPRPIARRDDVARAGFSVKVKDWVSPYRVLGLFAMPGETVDIETLFSRPGEAYSLIATAGTATEVEEGRWQWTAPAKPGAYVLHLEGPFETMTLNAFVKTPFDNTHPVLKGYKVGAYEPKPLRGDPRFVPPSGLVEVNAETAGVRVSPHFTLGAFTCHQPGNPKYVMLDERLLLKLEMLLEELNDRGIDAQTFTVMSGYRTPWYNRSIGNTTRYSQHLFGRAADVFVDDDHDGRMDDLNHDGRIDIGDARFLFDTIDGMKSESWYQPFLGGLGLYGPKSNHGPFVHVDARGYVARW